MKLSVKKGDNVLVITGKDAGKTGEVLSVNRDEKRVVVANVNVQTHHKKPRNQNDKGGKIKMEGPIDVSNVQVVCPTCQKATRVAKSIVDGKLVRVCKKCGASLDVAKKSSTKKAAKKEVAKTEAKKETEKKETVKKETAKTATKTTTAKTTATKKVAEKKETEAKKEVVKKPAAKSSKKA